MHLSVRTSDNDKLNLIDLLEDVIYTLVATERTKDGGNRTGQKNSFNFEWFLKKGNLVGNE